MAKGLGLGPAELPRQDYGPAYKVRLDETVHFYKPGMLTDILQSLYAILLLIYLDLGVIKISFILFYKRIFVGPHFRIVCNVMIAAITGWTIAQFIVSSTARTSFALLLTHTRRSRRSIPGISLYSGTTSSWTMVSSIPPWQCWI